MFAGRVLTLLGWGFVSVADIVVFLDDQDLDVIIDN